MPTTDLQYKDDLRRQRDDWKEILEYLDNDEPERAKKKAEKILSRITERLQDYKGAAPKYCTNRKGTPVNRVPRIP